jgi:peroxiredoxin
VVKVGDKAPDVQLIDSDRKQTKISDYQGKLTVLAFFPGAFTGVCTKEMCMFRDGLSRLNDLGASIVGISVDLPFSQKAFKDKYSIPFPLLSDYSREAVDAYDVALHDFVGLRGYTAAKRSIFILDEDGIVRFKWVSDDPKVEPDYERVYSEVQKLKK